MKKNERANVLSSLFFPKFWRELKELIQKCEMISDSTKALEFWEIVDIEFVFSNGNKQRVYCELIHAIKKGWVRVNQKQLAIYLAEHTNLASSPNLVTRINTIHHYLSRYKIHFT
jgi:hypothetical protein